MRRVREGYLTVTAILAAVGPAYAAGGPREDVSGIFVWAFLGLCALIIAAQVIPAVLMMIGAARGVAQGLKEKRELAAETRAKGA